MKRKIVLISSLIAGLIAALLTRAYLNTKEAEVEERKQFYEGRYGSMYVLVFARDVPAGAVISMDDLGELKLPKLGLEGKALTKENVQDIIGRKVVSSHVERDVVFWSDIEGGDMREVGLSAAIKKQMRAISINCSGAAAVSGMIKPNDHVDVIGTFDFDAVGGKKNFVTCTILQNVLVLATGSQTAKMNAVNLGMMNGSSYSTITLEVTPREAEMLAFAEQIKGRLMLSLRNRNDISYEKELPKVNFEKIQGEIEELNLKRQSQKLTNH